MRLVRRHCLNSSSLLSWLRLSRQTAGRDPATWCRGGGAPPSTGGSRRRPGRSAIWPLDPSAANATTLLRQPVGFGQPSSTQISATVAKLQQSAAFSPRLRHRTLTHQDLYEERPKRFPWLKFGGRARRNRGP